MQAKKKKLKKTNKNDPETKKKWNNLFISKANKQQDEYKSSTKQVLRVQWEDDLRDLITACPCL